MNRKMKKVSVAAIAGASAVLGVRPAVGALTIVATRFANQSIDGGTFDVLEFNLTGLTGPDATVAHNGGASYTDDAEVLALSGTFTVTGGTMNTFGKTASAPGNVIVSGSQTSLAGPNPGGKFSSYINYQSSQGVTLIGETGAANGAGTSTGISGNFYNNGPTVTSSGNQGGIEPGVDSNALVANYSDKYASTPAEADGLIGEFIVTPGANVSFTGTYVDYGPTATAAAPGALVFSSLATTGTGSTSTTGTNKIVSLLATGSNPAGTAPNGYGSAPLGTLSVTNAGGTGKYFPGYFNIPGGKSTGYVAVTGFLNNDYPEVYALQVQVGGATPTTAQINTIIGDISNSSSNVSSVTTVAGSSYAGIFSGYQILITDTTVDPYFAFDFSSSGSDTTDPDSALGPVTVTSIAAVPEPATAAGIILGAAGLLLGRRKNRLQPV
jgi:hypothetical protein